MKWNWMIAGVSALALVACGEEAVQDETAADDTAANATLAEIPENLAPFGDGYPNPGDPCRQLGESAETSDLLDDSALLVGCPDNASAEALGGEIVHDFEGVVLVSVPMGDANATMGENGPVDMTGDATVPGTEYNATAPVQCGFGGAEPSQSCDAGIIRNWGEDGTHLVEIQKPDGFKRAIFFDGTTPTGADSAEADGSAGWDFDVSRDGDRMTISYGPETYVLRDAMITGG